MIESLTHLRNQDFSEHLANNTTDLTTVDALSIPYFEKIVEKVLFVCQKAEQKLFEKQIHFCMENVKQLYHAYNSVYLNVETLISMLLARLEYFWNTEGKMQKKSKQTLVIQMRGFYRRNTNYKKHKNAIIFKKQLIVGIYFFCNIIA